MVNPLIPSKPKKINFVDNKKSAGILDDFAVRKNVATREGTIEKVPVNNSDIANKKYVDDNTHVRYTDAEAVTAVATADPYLKNNADDVTSGDLTIQGGELMLGVDDTAFGWLKMYGNSTTTGATIDLYNAAEEDTNISYFRINANGDQLEINNFDGNYIYLTKSGVEVGGTLSATSNITTIAPTTDLHCATKKYVDDEISGLGVFTPANFFVYKTTTQDLTNANTWYDITWADVDAPVNSGFTHDKTSNPEQITVTAAGNYLINVNIKIVPGASGGVAIRILDDGTEINGSWKAMVIAGGWNCEISSDVIATIGAGSVIEVQATSNVGGADIWYNPNLGAAPTTKSTASISITRVA